MIARCDRSEYFLNVAMRVMPGEDRAHSSR